MADPTTTKQSAHDAAVEAAKDIYRREGKHVWINPGSERNKKRKGYYIDVIASETVDADDTDKAWVIEVETEDSVTDFEAREQWANYDKAYSNWHLAVPTESKEKAEELTKKHGLAHCKIIRWTKESNGSHRFWGLPGV